MLCHIRVLLGGPLLADDYTSTRCVNISAETRFFIFKGAENVQIRLNIEIDISRNRNISHTYCVYEKVTNECACFSLQKERSIATWRIPHKVWMLSVCMHLFCLCCSVFR
jgi:hypothetical protein